MTIYWEAKVAKGGFEARLIKNGRTIDVIWRVSEKKLEKAMQSCAASDGFINVRWAE